VNYYYRNYNKRIIVSWRWLVFGWFLFSLYFSAVIKFSTHYMHVYIYIYVYYDQKKFSKCYFHWNIKMARPGLHASDVLWHTSQWAAGRFCLQTQQWGQHFRRTSEVPWWCLCHPQTSRSSQHWQWQRRSPDAGLSGVLTQSATRDRKTTCSA